MSWSLYVVFAFSLRAIVLFLFLLLWLYWDVTHLP